MDFLSLTTQIPLLLLLLFLPKIIIHYRLKSSSSKKGKSFQPLTPPETPGSWPLIGHLHLLGGPAPVARTLGAMADDLGPIFSLRLGRHLAVVVSSGEMVKECFAVNDRVFASRPSMAVGRFLGYDFACFALAPYGPYWRDVRKMATVDLLTTRRLHDLRHVRAAEVDGFVQDLYAMSGGGREAKKAVALSGRIEFLTFNIILRMLAGKKFSFSE